MATYSYSYRNSTGNLVRESAEAPSRQALFTQLKTRGVIPVDVSEGSPRARIGKRKWLVVCSLMLLAIAAGTLLVVLFKGPRQGDVSPASPLPQARTHVEPPTRIKTQPVQKQRPVAPPPKPTPVENKQKQALDKLRAQIYTDENGIKRWPGGLRYVEEKDIKHKSAVQTNTRDIFKHTSENRIAEVLTIEPGTSFIGEFRFGKAFEEDFRASLLDQVEITDDDTPSDRALKEAVIATKKELKNHFEAGESVAEIMNGALDELRRLGQYRDSLMAELHKIRHDGNYTAQDIKDFTEAANVMLQEKGLRKITLPKMLIRSLEIRDAKLKEGKE